MLISATSRSKRGARIGSVSTGKALRSRRWVPISMPPVSAIFAQPWDISTQSEQQKPEVQSDDRIRYLDTRVLCSQPRYPCLCPRVAGLFSGNGTKVLGGDRTLCILRDGQCR